MRSLYVWLGGSLLVAAISVNVAVAQRYESPNYTIDASVGNSFGGDTSSGSYKMTSSGGESIIGNGAGGSYMLDQGYVAQLQQSLELSINSASVDLGEITPGTSNQAQVDIGVRTDAPGYTIGIHQNNDLTFDSQTIPGVSGSIASPVSWSEGVTKGLGFTLSSTTATPIDAKWNSGASYAALPNASTTAYIRDGFTSGAEDSLTIDYRLDVDTSQVAGQYTNTVTYTGTVTP